MTKKEPWLNLPCSLDDATFPTSPISTTYDLMMSIRSSNLHLHIRDQFNIATVHHVTRFPRNNLLSPFQKIPEMLSMYRRDLKGITLNFTIIQRGHEKYLTQLILSSIINFQDDFSYQVSNDSQTAVRATSGVQRCMNKMTLASIITPSSSIMSFNNRLLIQHRY